MRTVKWIPFLSGVCTALGGMLLWAGSAGADISSTNPAAILIYPKILVDTVPDSSDTVLGLDGKEHTRIEIDTIIQLTNTAPDPVNVRCFYVNANGHCGNSPFAVCDPDADPESTPCASTDHCIPQWNETDFLFKLTARQPITWTASQGLSDLPLSPNCIEGRHCKIGPSETGQYNSGSIPPVSEVPFRGELKCIEVGDGELPTDSNDLKGEATIEDIRSHNSDVPSVDSRGYNAIGIQAIAGQPSTCDATGCTLTLGGDNAQYNGCPGVLLLDTFFDEAEDPASHSGLEVGTKLTLVPCSEDFKYQTTTKTTVQYLVYNEFEQRFSTSKATSCFTEIALSDIDTRLGDNPRNNDKSIFNVYVQGTLTGQILIRGVADSSTSQCNGNLCANGARQGQACEADTDCPLLRNGLLAIAEEFHCDGQCDFDKGTYKSAAYVTAQRGGRSQSDIILIPAAQPSE